MSTSAPETSNFTLKPDLIGPSSGVTTPSYLGKLASYAPLAAGVVGSVFFPSLAPVIMGAGAATSKLARDYVGGELSKGSFAQAALQGGLAAGGTYAALRAAPYITPAAKGVVNWFSPYLGSAQEAVGKVTGSAGTVLSGATENLSSAYGGLKKVYQVLGSDVGKLLTTNNVPQSLRDYVQSKLSLGGTTEATGSVVNVPETGVPAAQSILNNIVTKNVVNRKLLALGLGGSALLGAALLYNKDTRTKLLNLPGTAGGYLKSGLGSLGNYIPTLGGIKGTLASAGTGLANLFSWGDSSKKSNSGRQR